MLVGLGVLPPGGHGAGTVGEMSVGKLIVVCIPRAPAKMATQFQDSDTQDFILFTGITLHFVKQNCTEITKGRALPKTLNGLDGF